MTNLEPVIGWTSAYLSSYPTVKFTEMRRKALVERIRKRAYDFTHSDHQFQNYGAPFYADNVICVLTKHEWDSVLEEAYHNRLREGRLLPEDVIDRKHVKDVLFEKEKWEFKE